METAAGGWLLSAVMSGLGSAGHCALMCGAPMAAVIAARRVPASASSALVIPLASPSLRPALGDAGLALAAQCGRILSYGAGGLLAGLLGMGATQATGPAWSALATAWLAILAQGVVLLTGLYLLGLSNGIRRLEGPAARLWPHLARITGRVGPVQSPGGALAFGALWGWIPCGLSYAMLLVAFGAADPLLGMAILTAFGIGTLPVTVGIGSVSGSAAALLRNPTTRRIAGSIVVLMALAGAYRVASGPTLAPLL
ncbi:MAG TPA: sulfite exporter TauE/SafE family protein, partial [Usitatibacteraceae bacterium]|nr:sulfite exporter TauE/SafE family protein [Usitatibacteraceae bacterium]